MAYDEFSAGVRNILAAIAGGAFLFVVADKCGVAVAASLPAIAMIVLVLALVIMILTVRS